MFYLLSQRSFSRLTLIAILVFILTTNVTAGPITVLSFESQRHSLAPRQLESISSNNSTNSSASNNGNDAQTIVTSQIIPDADGNTTEVCTFTFTPTTLSDGNKSISVEKNCTFTFVPSPTATDRSVSTSTFVTTVVQGSSTMSASATESPGSTTLLNPSPSTVSISSIITPSSSPNPVRQPSASSGFVSSSSRTPDHASIPLETISSATASAASGSQTTFGDSNDKGHLQTLPIFLGAFGGVAGFALIIVGCMVYHPIKRLNEWRLNPPTCFLRHRFKPRYQSQATDFKGGEPTVSAEKLTTSPDMRCSHESTPSSAEISRWSRDSGGLTPWGQSPQKH